MYTRNTRLIAVDLDNTLLTSQKDISDFTLRTLRECRRRGILIAMSTGRSFVTSYDWAQRLKPDARVLTCGAVVYVGNEIIARTAIDVRTANKLIGSCMQLKTTRELYVETEENLYGNSREEIRDFPQLARVQYNDFSLPMTAPVVSVYVRLYDMEAAKRIEEDFPDIASVYFSDQYMHAYTRKGVSKWEGIRALCGYYGFTAEEVTYFGDDFSDLIAMKNCGVSVAMANAIDPVKEVASHLTLNNDEDGVAVWIDKHILANTSNTADISNTAGTSNTVGTSNTAGTSNTVDTSNTSTTSNNDEKSFL
ncbi:MAG: Cof-type HAD-IIB family hydrolase [Oscillospiraceae bacterium]|nr:Cof-type HAD-IIB family hydrolase [Oscillospiraceae bacterium]